MMNQSTRLVTTAINLNANRSFIKDLHGFEKTPQGEEFAKAIAEAAVSGMPPEAIAEEVIKAMGGNETAALDLLQAVQEIAKAHVEAYTRTLPNGKTVNVNAYENARTGAMKATTMAHGATFRAMRAKSPQEHSNAAAAHEAAAKSHADAHAIHPRDVPEVGEEHAKLQAQHTIAADFHKGEAAKIQHGADYQRAADNAEQKSQNVKIAQDSASRARFHKAAADAHQKAAELEPGKGHEQRAEGHTMLAESENAKWDSARSPHGHEVARGAHRATSEAHEATARAIESGKREDHGKAAALHARAIMEHMKVHGEHESDEDGHHGKLAERHMKLHAFHTGKSGTKEEVAKAVRDWNAENRDKLKSGELKGQFAGPHESFPISSPKDITHAFMLLHHSDHPEEVKANLLRIAKEHGWESHVPEGERPKEDEEKGEGEEVGKAHVGEHTRTQGGKVVQVSAYETHRDAAHHAMHEAYKASAYPDSLDAKGHAAAASAHKKGADLHREAAKYAPDEWRKAGHEQQAKAHDIMAQGHAKHAAAAGSRADTGVDAKPHSEQSIKSLEDHEDYEGHGYLGEGSRSPATDKALAEAANNAGVSHHHLAAHILSQSGRHMMDDHSNLGENPSHEERVAHFQRWITDPKKEKSYGIKEYSRDLEKRAKPAQKDKKK